MGQLHDELTDRHIEFIAEQKLFFVATATADSRVNISPKGMDSFRVLDKRRVAWLNLTGSSNETAAHVQQLPRMTIMFCSFVGAPLILRLYGTARVIHRGDAGWDEFYSLFQPLPGARQIFEVSVDLVQTSCGMAVPCFDYAGDRKQLTDWADRKGAEGVRRYWQEKNQTSIDGLPTHIIEKSD